MVFNFLKSIFKGDFKIVDPVLCDIGWLNPENVFFQLCKF